MAVDRESIARRIIRLAAFVVTALGFILAFFHTFDLADQINLSEDNQKLIAIWYIIIFSVGVLLFLSFRFYIADRKEKFANISPTLHSAVGRCKDLLTTIETKSDLPLGVLQAADILQLAKKELREVCDAVVLIFGLLTGTHCRAAIKVIIPGSDGKLYVIALARDHVTTNRAPKFDAERRETNQDPLAKNKQFLRMANDRMPNYVFCSNGLHEKNLGWTSIGAYRAAHQEQLYPRTFWKQLTRRKRVLPYRSTLTVAIRRTIDSVALDEPIVVGFLAVDSESRGVFSPRWDQHILALVADALFHPVDRLLALLQETEQSSGRRRGVTHRVRRGRG